MLTFIIFLFLFANSNVLSDEGPYLQMMFGFQ